MLSFSLAANSFNPFYFLNFFFYGFVFIFPNQIKIGIKIIPIVNKIRNSPSKERAMVKKIRISTTTNIQKTINLMLLIIFSFINSVLFVL